MTRDQTLLIEITEQLKVLQATVNELRRDIAYLKADRCYECRRELDKKDTR